MTDRAHALQHSFSCLARFAICDTTIANAASAMALLAKVVLLSRWVASQAYVCYRQLRATVCGFPRFQLDSRKKLQCPAENRDADNTSATVRKPRHNHHSHVLAPLLFRYTASSRYASACTGLAARHLCRHLDYDTRRFPDQHT